MESLGKDLVMNHSPIIRSKQENRERAFVAASRRKDRSLDARIQSANCASQLHKERTGKALHITKEIVEKEATYEEICDHYQQRRLQLMRHQTDTLELQFQSQLLAALGYNANNTHNTTRVSSGGGVQKVRIGNPVPQPYSQNQYGAAMRSFGMVPSSKASSPAHLETHVQGSASLYIQMLRARSSLTQRITSVENTLSLQLQQSGIPSPKSQQLSWVESEPSRLQMAPAGDNGQTLLYLSGEALPTGEFSASPITSELCQLRSGDDQMLPAVRENSDIEQPTIPSTETMDSDYDEFTCFELALGIQTQWEMPLVEVDGVDN